MDKGSRVNSGVSRRGLLLNGLVAGAGLALPARVFAMAADLPPQERRLVATAREQLARNPSITRKDVVGIADFGRASADPRLHFIHMEEGRVQSFLVAHGRGSDPEHDGWLKHFSNTIGSEATSRGAYSTCAWYEGKYGTSIRLRGLDGDNSNAFDRAVVMHPAWYAATDMLTKWGKLGRSEGCFAMDPEHFGQALWYLAGGRLLYADRLSEA